MTWAYVQHPTGTKDITTPTLKFVLVTMGNYANEDWETWRRVDVLAADTDLNKRTILRALDRLQALDLVADTGTRKGRTKRVVVYRLNGANPSLSNGANPSPLIVTGRHDSSLGVSGSKSEPKPEPTSAPSRRADPMFDAIFEVWSESLPDGLAYPPTRSEAGRIAKAKADLVEHGATPAEVIRRGANWRTSHPGYECPPQSLAGNWSSLATVRPPRPNGRGSDAIARLRAQEVPV